MFTRERHRARRPLLRPVLVGARGPLDARDAEQGVPLPAVRGARRPAGARACRASTTTSAAARRPASNLISREDYRAVIDQVIMFLEGRTRPIERDLERRMHEASAGAGVRGGRPPPQPPDLAAHARAAAAGRLGQLARTTSSRSRSTTASPTSSSSRCASGRLDERRSMYLENIGDAPRRRAARLASSPSTTPSRSACRRSSSCPCELDDQDVFEEYLSERRGSRVEVRVAARGEKRRMLELAERNAELALRHEALAAARTRARRAEALEELREALDLEALPVRIECFDASNLGETQRVASMVVFEEAVPRRSDYRQFGDPPRGRAGRLPLDRRGRAPALRPLPARRGGGLRPRASRRCRTWS